MTPFLIDLLKLKSGKMKFLSVCFVQDNINLRHQSRQIFRGKLSNCLKSEFKIEKSTTVVSPPLSETPTQASTLQQECLI